MQFNGRTPPSSHLSRRSFKVYFLRSRVLSTAIVPSTGQTTTTTSTQRQSRRQQEQEEQQYTRGNLMHTKAFRGEAASLQHARTTFRSERISPTATSRTKISLFQCRSLSASTSTSTTPDDHHDTAIATAISTAPGSPLESPFSRGPRTSRPLAPVASAAGCTAPSASPGSGSRLRQCCSLLPSPPIAVGGQTVVVVVVVVDNVVIVVIIVFASFWRLVPVQNGDGQHETSQGSRSTGNTGCFPSLLVALVPSSECV